MHPCRSNSTCTACTRAYDQYLYCSVPVLQHHKVRLRQYPYCSSSSSYCCCCPYFSPVRTPTQPTPVVTTLPRVTVSALRGSLGPRAFEGGFNPAPLAWLRPPGRLCSLHVIFLLALRGSLGPRACEGGSLGSSPRPLWPPVSAPGPLVGGRGESYTPAVYAKLAIIPNT